MRAGRRLTGLAVAALTVGGVVGAAPTAASAVTDGTHHASAAASAASQNRLVRHAQARRAFAERSRPSLRTITDAVHRSEFTDGVPASSYTVTGLRASGSWARAELKPSRGVELDQATVVLRRSSNRWQVVDLGTAQVGCEVAPAATLRALHLRCD